MIAFHIDYNYVLFAELFLMSIAKNAPNEDVFLSAINVDQADVDRLRKANGKLIVDNKWITDTGNVRWRQYMQCRVTKVLIDTYNRANDNEICIVTDADVILKNPLSDIYNRMECCDMLLIESDQEHREKKELCNGVIVFRKKPEVLEFLNSYNEMWERPIE